MRLKTNEIKTGLDYTDADVRQAVARKLKCPPQLIGSLIVLRRSLDARRKDAPPHYSLTVEFEFSGKVARLKKGVAEPAPVPEPPFRAPSLPALSAPPLVVGAGPAGLMAALILAEAGLKPILIERGADTAERSRQVEAFWRDGLLDPESNVLYGEGGAGLFSDGKLTARSKDRARIRRFFEVMVECGASPDILIDAEPHIGSDVLAELIPALRRRICEAGGQVLFGQRLENLHVENGKLCGAVVSGREMDISACLLATGHSARDVYSMLADCGVQLVPKPFAVGVRLEIPQHRINRAQYGKWADDARLGSASFRLTRREEAGARRCYTFCMCPGGLVMACASAPGLLTTNGMSLSGRDKPFGNAAFLVPVGPEDFPEAEHPAFSGIEFQRKMERAAFEAGGGKYGLPAMRLPDFLDAAVPSDLPGERSCLTAVPADLHRVLPDFVLQTLHSAVPEMLRALPGVELDEALLYAAETRSSSPLRIVRNDDGQAPGVAGLYPCGEGSGFAGGIVSSALDGMKAAEQLIMNR